MLSFNEVMKEKKKKEKRNYCSKSSSTKKKELHFFFLLHFLLYVVYMNVSYVFVNVEAIEKDEEHEYNSSTYTKRKITTTHLHTADFISFVTFFFNIYSYNVLLVDCTGWVIINVVVIWNKTMLVHAYKQTKHIHARLTNIQAPI